MKLTEKGRRAAKSPKIRTEGFRGVTGYLNPDPSTFFRGNNLQTLAKRMEGLTLDGMDYEGGLYRNPTSTTPVDMREQTRKFFLDLASASTNLAISESDTADIKEAKAKALKTVRDALDGDRTALRELSSLRLETTNNFIRASSNFMGFFDIVTLQESEEPGVKNETFNEIKVGVLGQDGNPRQIKVEVDQAHARIPLRYISSETVGYRTEDIYKGNIAQLAVKTFEIAFDLNFKVDREAYNLLVAALGSGGAFGAFTFTGNRASRIYVPHSGIVTTHLPTTNDIDLSADLDEFDPEVLLQAIQYADSWFNVFPDGPLLLTGEVVVPASDIFAILHNLTLVNTSENRPTESELNRQVQNQGYTELTIANRRFRFVPDVTIPKGTCFPKTNKKPGQFFLKPSLDKEFVDTNAKENWEERQQRKVIGAFIYEQRRMNVLRIKYRVRHTDKQNVLQREK